VLVNSAVDFEFHARRWDTNCKKQAKGTIISPIAIPRINCGWMTAVRNELSQGNMTTSRGRDSRLVWWLRGASPVTWRRSTGWYLRCLGAIYLIAFISLYTQIDGLVGSNGLEPIARFLAAVSAYAGDTPWWKLPTLCWLKSSDAFLHVQCIAGVALSILAISGIAQIPVFACLWILYLSLSVACQQFLGYQWDALLLEAGLLAMFLAPARWLAWKPGWEEPPIVMMWLQRWLIFRLMILSGIIKLASGDPNWRNLTALTFHYWSQPLPTWTSWYASHWPLWFQKFSCVNMFVVELGAPMLVFGPRKLRVLAAAAVVFLQLLILGTGNYGFFNLLAIALCIPLLDDAMLPPLWPARWTKAAATPPGERVAPWLGKARHIATIIVAAIIVPATLNEALLRCRVPVPLPEGIESALQSFAPLRSLNAYGLFEVMTTGRRELIFEGSNDGMQWKEYQFKWKPGDVSKPPAFCAPHMPRVDWQLWFASLYPQSNWDFLQSLMQSILRGSRPVMDLMGDDPFNGRPPRYVRLRTYEYRFTTSDERARSGAWWTRTDTGVASSMYSLGNGGGVP
jgi:lipase maturation factor 1